jgi:hypothetical protein
VSNHIYTPCDDDKGQHLKQILFIDMDGVIANWGKAAVSVLNSYGYGDKDGEMLDGDILKHGYHFHNHCFDEFGDACDFETLNELWTNNVVEGHGYSNLEALPMVGDVLTCLENQESCDYKVVFISKTMVDALYALDTVAQQKHEWLKKRFGAFYEDSFGLIVPKPCVTKSTAARQWLENTGHSADSYALVDDNAANCINWENCMPKATALLVDTDWNQNDDYDGANRACPYVAGLLLSEGLHTGQLSADPAQPGTPPQKTVADKTNPSHYQFSNGAQVIDITQALMFPEGNVVKYVARAGKKGGESQLDDLRKAKYYLDLAIEIAEREAE